MRSNLPIKCREHSNSTFKLKRLLCYTFYLTAYKLIFKKKKLRAIKSYSTYLVAYKTIFNLVLSVFIQLFNCVCILLMNRFPINVLAMFT
jgi:hypothetical protein